MRCWKLSWLLQALVPDECQVLADDVFTPLKAGIFKDLSTDSWESLKWSAQTWCECWEVEMRTSESTPSGTVCSSSHSLGSCLKFRFWMVISACSFVSLAFGHCSGHYSSVGMYGWCHQWEGKRTETCFLR